MLCSPLKMVCFRLYLLTIGRFPYGSAFVRKLLMRLVQRKGSMTYVAHADFLDLRQFAESQQIPGPLWDSARCHNDKPNACQESMK